MRPIARVVLGTVVVLAAAGGTLALRPTSEPRPTTPATVVNGVPLSELVAGVPTRGSKAPDVLLVTFLDYRCEFCLRHEREVVQTLLGEYGDRLQVAVRLVPRDDLHPGANRVAEAALCAGEQGRFWDYHETLVNNPLRQDDELQARARALRLDIKEFARCQAEHRPAGRLRADAVLSERLRVPGTPSTVVGDQLVVGAKPIERFRELIDAALADPAERSRFVEFSESHER